MNFLLYIVVGLVAGTLGGAFGIGGGTIMVPALVFLFGLTQHQAQGTALTVMLTPVFLFAVMRYYQAGNVKIQMALFIAAGFLIGALAGAHFIQGVPEAATKRAFGIFLILLGLKYLFLK